MVNISLWVSYAIAKYRRFLMDYLGIVLVKPSEASMTLIRPEYPSLVLQCFSMACNIIQFEKRRGGMSVINCKKPQKKRISKELTRSECRHSYLSDLPGVFLVLPLPCDPVKYE